jgi:hypothetical protein
MRRKANHGRGFLIFEQIGDEAFKRDLSLRKGTLIERCKNLPGLDQRNELLEEIGCDHLNLSKQSFFLKSLQHRNTIRRADIQPLRPAVTAEQRKRLSIGLLGTFMRLDSWQQSEMRSKHGEGSCEAAKFFRVVDSGKFTSHRSHMSLATQFVRQKLGRQRTTCVCVRRNETNTTTTWRIAGDAKHRSAVVGQTTDNRIKFSRITRGKDNAVVPLLQLGLQHLGISVSEARIFMEDHIDVHSNGSICRSPDAGAQRVEEMRDLFGENHSDLDSPVELQRLRSEIGSISQSLCRLPHTFFRLWADPGTFMQCTIHRADRDAKFSRNVFDTRSLRRIFHKIRNWNKKYKSHVTAITQQMRDFPIFQLRRAYRDFLSQSILSAPNRTERIR